MSNESEIVVSKKEREQIGREAVKLFLLRHIQGTGKALNSLMTQYNYGKQEFTVNNMAYYQNARAYLVGCLKSLFPEYAERKINGETEDGAVSTDSK